MEDTNLVDEIGQQALNLININPCPTRRMCSNSQCSRKLGHGHTGSPNGWLAILGLFESTGDENLSEEVAQGNVAATLQREIDTSLDKFCFTGRHRLVEADKVTLSDAIGQGTEELLQSWEGCKKSPAGKCVGSHQVARN
jgi:hypothetical protein